MECVWDQALLRREDDLPVELIQIIRHGSDEQYLNSLCEAACDPRYTHLLFSYCSDIFAHICLTTIRRSCIAGLAILGRIITAAPHLQSLALRALHASFAIVKNVSAEEQTHHLLATFRLLCHNPRRFNRAIDSAYISSSLQSADLSHRYLAIRILQIRLHGADHWFEGMLAAHIGADDPTKPITGVWDDRDIDYRFLSLWENHRSKQCANFRDQARIELDASAPTRILLTALFDAGTTLIAQTLFLRNTGTIDNNEEFVLTDTALTNAKRLASCLQQPGPILLQGPTGAGKTTLIRYAASKLGKLNDIVTLHLNEQSDAKLLVGIYTTGSSPGSIVWKPGVLTTAVQEGRWVVIEDLDRAPDHIIGALLPLIERGELSIPSRRQLIHAHAEFRLIATTKTGRSVKALPHMLGRRLWQDVLIDELISDEYMQILNHRFPTLSRLLPQIMALFERLRVLSASSTFAGRNKGGTMRSISARDLFTWCHRQANLLKTRSTFTTDDIDAMFHEAADCFAGSLAPGPAREQIFAVIAEELHIDPQRRDFLLSERPITYSTSASEAVVGRYVLKRSDTSKKRSTPFSTNQETVRTMERIAAAVTNREPLLLVGETGVGKTTAVQHLATSLGKKLVAFNLSQQSESGDLLGGFKPVNTRSLVIGLKDEFDALFSTSFSQSRNQQFTEHLNKYLARSKWKAVCKLWREALKMVAEQSQPASRQVENPSKKRKVDNSLQNKWDVFASHLTDLERQLSAGTESFAFKFVEGNIVKALRNGEWILLDEINLAAPDTLEALIDLLDSRHPSLLLTEAGNIERVVAHPDFRVFAAMNPATDVGKKDLPPGIRAHFTELYVESPDSNLKSLQSIVQAYLKQTPDDTTIAADVSVLYRQIQDLAQQNRLVDGAGQRPHFSLRTLTRTLTYARQIAPQCSLRRALYEGFQMSFMTFLDTESIKLVTPLLHKSLFQKKVNLQTELRKSLRKPADGSNYVQAHPQSKHYIRQGPHAIQEESQYIITPFIRDNLENLVRAASTRQFPVLIQGPTSSGKTSMIEYLAKRTGHEFVRINNHEHTDLQEYLGTYVSTSDGKLQFQDGLLVKALREGHWIVLDELNLAPTDVLEALNRLLDDNRELLIPETQEVVRPHAEFMLFATQNPAGLYGGRKTLSRAFRNRFLELHFDDIPIDELQEILQQRTLLPESRCKRIVAVYRELSVLRQESRIFEQKSFATLRDLFRWAFRTNDTIEQLANNGFMLLAERVRKADERQAIKQVIETVMSKGGPRVVIDDAKLYNGGASEIVQYAAGKSNRSVVWTKAMRRLYLLVARALQHNEPILLVGDTGCGKTMVCQMIADALGRELNIVNAHQNTETGDLIGSQRPVRNRAVVEADLRDLISSSSLFETVLDPTTQSTTDLLEAYHQALTDLSPEARQELIDSTHHESIVQATTRYRALFEWADGSLVQAMKSGSIFLLDEISLADDSVLERLNSVLEPSRSILLAEKGSLDSFVRASDDFQFLATMNPGGDYGKKELSPALRNRFTEIWVPAMSDTDDTLEIIEHELVADAKPAANGMLAFALWFKSSFDVSSSSGLSIREILSWVSFVNRFALNDIAAAVVHGAALVYIDTLGTNPAGLTSLSDASIEKSRSVCLDKLVELVHVDAHNIYHAKLSLSFSKSTFGIGPFTLPLRGVSDQAQQFSFAADTTKQNALRVVRAMQLSKPIMLEGNPGVGKTALVTAIASIAGVPLTRINLSEQTDLIDLFGSDAPVKGSEAGAFAWRDAPFLRALKAGEWVLLDEMNLASQSVLEGLNAVLDHRGEAFVPELGLSFAKHPDFRLFAAQNPHHQGGGRKGLPASFVNRFTVVYADPFNASDLLALAQQASPDTEAGLLQRLIHLTTQLDNDVNNHRAFGSSGSPWEFNLRDILKWIELLKTDAPLIHGGSAADFMDLLFIQRFRRESDRQYAISIFTKVFERELQLSDCTTNLSASVLQTGLAALRRHETRSSLLQSTPALHRSPNTLRTMQSVMVCIQHRWPVLLTGTSGCGKTAVITSLASVLGAEVETIAMNSETDSMDFIGGYEQTDAHREIVSLLLEFEELLYATLKSSLLSQAAQAVTDHSAAWQELRTSFEKGSMSAADLLRSAEKMPLPGVQRLLKQIASGTRTRESTSFAWLDGILINALQTGKWLILDNANLCSASVLDRLNSLLEVNGALILNEHVESDGSPRIIRPHPDFRMFMTTDPKYGELSRAMRNRAVELFMPIETERCPVLFTSTESAMHRLRHADVIQREPDNIQRLRDLFADDLSLGDNTLVSRLNQQLTNGLFQSAQCVIQAIPDDSRHSAMTKQLLHSKQFAQQAVKHWQLPADFARAQTIHPLSNPSIFQQDGIVLESILRTGLAIDLIRLTTRLLDQEKFLESQRHITSQLIQCERHLASNSQKRSKDASSTLAVIKAVLTRIQDILEQPDSVQTLIAVSSSASPSLQGLETFSSLPARQLLAVVQQLLNSIHTQRFDVCTLQAGLSLAYKKSVFEGGNEVNGLRTILASPLTTQDSAWGKQCVTIWQAMQPNSFRTIAHLESVASLEIIIHAIDQACLQFRQPLADNIALRTSIEQIWHTAVNNPESDVKTLIDSLGNHELVEDSDSRQTTSPHFSGTFKSLNKIMVLEGASNGASLTADFTRALSLLSGQPALINAQSFIQYDGQTLTVPSQLTIDNDVGSSIITDFLRQVGSCASISLSQVSLLRSELSVLATGLFHSSDKLTTGLIRPLDALLRRCLSAVLSALCQSDTAGGHAQSLLDELHTTKHSKRRWQNFASDAYKPLALVVEYLNNGHERQDDHIRPAGLAWMSYGLACIIAYMPAMTFDPGALSIAARSSFDSCHQEIKDSIDAVQFLHESISGGPCLRERLLRDELYNLGDGPPIPQIIRPFPSQALNLQTDLDSLRRVMIDVEGQLNSGQLQIVDQSTLANIRQSRARLLSYRAHIDFIGPLIHFIDSFLVGAVLVSQSSTQESQAYNDQHTLDIVPLRAGRLTIWQSEDTLLALLHQDHDVQTSLSLLQVLSCRNSIAPLAGASIELHTQLELQFRKLYDQWSKQLTYDQRQEAARTSLYKYTGGDADDDLEPEQLRELFPDFDREVEADNTALAAHTRVRDFAWRISEVHRMLVLPSPLTKDHVLEMLAQSINMTKVDNSNASTFNDLVAALVALARLSETVDAGAGSKGSTNFYHGSNMLQLDRLQKLIASIRQKFGSVHEIWPEHAIPIQVEEQCTKILAIAYSEPLPRYLVYVEQLHSTINEWQKIASSEHSAATHFSSLTDLIVDWRRIELSTWAKLFDEENAMCSKAAASWWFTAYESIIASTQDMPELLDSISHATALLETLESFLRSSGLGEYSARLDILRSFAGHLSTISLSQHGHGSLLAASLASFVHFYSRFESAVTQELQTRRKKLEADIRDVIQLASWKDRNIDSLRQSAKASHKKLFRIVRKYRTVLFQPVSPLLAVEPALLQRQPPAEPGNLSQVLKQGQAVERHPLDSTEAWSARPKRYQNVAQTCALMVQRFGSFDEWFEAAERLRAIGTELDVAMQELRKATPTIASEKNKALVNHLKNRKRRLLADVLRDLRAMGLQPNIPDEVLVKQKTISHCLVASSNKLSGQQNGVIPTHESDHLFRLFALMPAVREGSRKHTDDLTNAEVSRCTALLESILDLAIHQRNTVASMETEFSHVSSLIARIEAFSKSDRPQSLLCSSKASIVSSARCAVAVGEAAADLLEKHDTATGDHNGEIISELRSMLQECSATAIAIQQLPDQPAHIQDSTERRLRDDLNQQYMQLASFASSTSADHPELEYLVKHIRDWICIEDSAESVESKDESATAQTWTVSLQKNLDQILGAAEAFAPRDTASDDKAAWLRREQNLMESAWNSLSVRRISSSLEVLLHQISESGGPARTISALAHICGEVLPLLQVYRAAAANVQRASSSLHEETVRLAHFLGKTFTNLARDGFCSPPDRDDKQKQDSGEAEAGTGLADGEGAEDISKDIKDDEDLSELAQEGKKEKREDDIEDEKDAVDMADEELEGETGDVETKSDDENGEDGDDPDDDAMDEEIGSFNEDDANQLDEKMWDDGKTEEKQDKSSSKSKGTKDDDLAAAEDGDKDTQQEESLDDGQGDEENDQAPSEGDEEVGRAEVEEANPHMQEEANLDLPDDIDLEGRDADESDSDVDMQDMEDIDQQDTDVAEHDEGTAEEADDNPDENVSENGSATQEAGAEVEDDVENAEESSENEANILQRDDEQHNEANAGMVVDEQGSGQDQSADEPAHGNAQDQDSSDAKHTTEPQDDMNGQSAASTGQQGEAQDSEKPANDEATARSQFQKLGDIMEKWYNQNRPIEAPTQSGQESDNAAKQDVNMADVTFEHLEDENDQSDAQAIGTGSMDQSKALPEDNSIPVNDEAGQQDMPPLEDEKTDDLDKPMDPATESMPEQQRADDVKAFIGNHDTLDQQMHDVSDSDADIEATTDVESVDEQLTNTHLSGEEHHNRMSMAEARQLWTTHENNTRNLSLMLTEHLRLILQPTQATKMRGDFRTGKRLNIKKIIPYIASSYKRDKIWMRRTIPSKRAYQIMLAIDDSKSMAESDSKSLAFETLAMVAKSLSMLEVGELCVLGFGEDVTVAHDFSTPFTSDAGAQVFQSFTFDQTKTNVQKLLTESLELFRAARIRATGSSSELWQLQIIISDGVCEDHPHIRQLVRQAHEERIMIVFIIVDALATQSTNGNQVKQSILDLQTAEFTKDAAGEMQLNMVRYLDTFPFNYYLLVRDTQELPSVLAAALRQWFAEVVDTGSN